MALQAADGAKIWEVDFQKELESKLGYWGFLCLPAAAG